MHYILYTVYYISVPLPLTPSTNVHTSFSAFVCLCLSLTLDLCIHRLLCLVSSCLVLPCHSLSLPLPLFLPYPNLTNMIKVKQAISNAKANKWHVELDARLSMKRQGGYPLCCTVPSKNRGHWCKRSFHRAGCAYTSFNCRSHCGRMIGPLYRSLLNLSALCYASLSPRYLVFFFDDWDRRICHSRPSPIYSHFEYCVQRSDFSPHTRTTGSFHATDVEKPYVK